MKKIVQNTVMGHPEPVFREAWISVLWKAMAKLARGYRMHTLKNQPPKGASRWRGERRKDKPGTTKLTRFLAQRATPALKRGNFPETK